MSSFQAWGGLSHPLELTLQELQLPLKLLVCIGQFVFRVHVLAVKLLELGFVASAGLIQRFLG